MSTLPRIMHNGSVAGYGWRLSDAIWEEVEYTSDDLAFHADDLAMVVEHYQAKIDAIKFGILQRTIFPSGLDTVSLFQCIVYILKFLELMSGQLGLRSLTDAVILGHEAGASPIEQQKLAEIWAAKSEAWLNIVGIAESEASQAKAAISECDNDTDMGEVMDRFSAILEGALQ